MVGCRGKRYRMIDMAFAPLTRRSLHGFGVAHPIGADQRLIDAISEIKGNSNVFRPNQVLVADARNRYVFVQMIGGSRDGLF